ncbi:hypothetical protein JTE90_018680 [Oedothorax gibbosus]|uniref:Uncharacterized protein n=1 Tax=Oedothorax gibbosus TaxID=931172 RepID=A0AAV6V030_9ARAC|nr:hypothetical protein JTE90_018680 [Oedothorax gibbosus]
MDPPTGKGAYAPNSSSPPPISDVTSHSYANARKTPVTAVYQPMAVKHSDPDVSSSVSLHAIETHMEDHGRASHHPTVPLSQKDPLLQEIELP